MERLDLRSRRRLVGAVDRGFQPMNLAERILAEESSTRSAARQWSWSVQPTSVAAMSNATPVSATRSDTGAVKAGLVFLPLAGLAPSFGAVAASGGPLTARERAMASSGRRVGMNRTRCCARLSATGSFRRSTCRPSAGMSRGSGSRGELSCERCRQRYPKRVKCL